MKTLTRIQTLEWLLLTFNQASEPLQASGSGRSGKPESRLLLMPAIWHKGSYAAVETALKKLKMNEPGLYWHVCERYLRSETRIAERYVSRKTRKGSFVEPRREVVETWDPDVDLRKVSKGVEWLSSNIVGELYLPLEILEVV